MATTSDTKRPMNFSGMAGGTKRRRVRSGGSQSTNNTGAQDDDDLSDEKTTQTSKCKGTTTIPIFLKKTYKMIDTCDDNIAAWTPDGEMFVVKDPDLFASAIIPQYFDHNKFSSFARQLNFYGFRKMQSKPIRNSDFDTNTAKHVTFFNENFKRGRCDLLKKIQRSTRGGGNNSAQDHQREVQNLKEQVATLENKVQEMSTQFEERMRRLELDMLGRMEQMMLAMAQQQQTQLQIQGTGGSSGASGTAAGALSSLRGASQTGESWEPLPYARGSSITASSLFSAPAPQGAAAASSAGSAAAASAASGNNKDSKTSGGSGSGGPTLPPHPKQKPMPPTLPPHPKQKGNAQTLSSGLPNHMSYPPTRLSSLARGLSRGISNLSRGLSSESQSSAMMLRNSWEDKFFSMLMLGENDAAAAAAAQNAMAQNMAAMGHQQGHGAPGSAQMPSSGANGLSGLSALTDRSFLAQFGGQLPRLSSEMSSVSASAAALGQR